MNILSYLAKFPQQNRITVVGPMECDPALTLLNRRQPCIFVDGGSRHRKGHWGLCVGDGDSADVAMNVKLPADKDVSDLAYVLTNLPCHLTKIDLVGFLGGRRDHEMINFGEVQRFLKSRSSATKVVFDHAISAYSQGRWEFYGDGLFSVLVIEPCQLTLSGAVKYPVISPLVFAPLSSLGLSNEGFGKVFLHCDAPVFVVNPRESA